MNPLLNEVVLRFTAFGLSGAHVKRMVVETDSLSGRTVERVGAPEPVFGYPALQQVLGEALTAALEANGSLQQERDALQADVSAKDAQIASLSDDFAAAQQQIADLQAQLAAATEPPAPNPEPDAGDPEQPTDQPA